MDTIKMLLEKANRLPLLPGVYIMLDDKGEVIYVGKAKKLKNRVSSYFHGEHLPKVAAMAEKVADFDVVVVNSEFEALILENSLIKRHMPHYQLAAKFLFHTGDMGAERLLGDVQAFSGACKAELLRQHREIFHRGEIHDRLL